MKTYDSITPELTEWAMQQPLYFIATAPMAEDGHINVSPRGLNHLRIVDTHQVLLLDLTGSGNESAAHVAENRRLTIMFCAFEGAPRILRLYGEAEVLLPDNPEWEELRNHFATNISGVRQIFRININRVQTSCGFGVPLMDFVSQREVLTQWTQNKDPAALETYQKKNNRVSIDGLHAPFVK